MRRLALTYSVTVTLVFQKRYFVDHLRLQIVERRKEGAKYITHDDIYIS